MADLETLTEVETVLVTVAGVDLGVTPLVAREFAPFSRALRPIMDELPALAGGRIDAATVLALMEQGDHLVQAVAIATRQSVEWVGGLEADELIVLVLAVMEVNANFFARRLMPQLMGRVAQTVGSLSDNASSATGTPAG